MNGRGRKQHLPGEQPDAGPDLHGLGAGVRLGKRAAPAPASAPPRTWATLVVYDNGLATWSQSNADGSGNSRLQRKLPRQRPGLGQAQVNAFVQSFAAAGAFRQSVQQRQPGANGQHSSRGHRLHVQAGIEQGSANTVQTFSVDGRQLSGDGGGVSRAPLGILQQQLRYAGSGNGGSGSGGSGAEP